MPKRISAFSVAASKAESSSAENGRRSSRGSAASFVFEIPVRGFEEMKPDFTK
ncbi:MAG: hypothetical protein FWG74_07735 [Planctomycetes bacterium]|nr:hypothetical protein [Planctomycetota bacterium]